MKTTSYQVKVIDPEGISVTQTMDLPIYGCEKASRFVHDAIISRIEGCKNPIACTEIVGEPIHPALPESVRMILGAQLARLDKLADSLVKDAAAQQPDTPVYAHERDHGGHVQARAGIARMIRTCETCEHNGHDCVPVRCIEGGTRLMWAPIITHDTIADVERYADLIGHTSNYGATRRPDGRYELKLEVSEA